MVVGSSILPPLQPKQGTQIIELRIGNGFFITGIRTRSLADMITYELGAVKGGIVEGDIRVVNSRKETSSLASAQRIHRPRKIISPA